MWDTKKWSDRRSQSKPFPFGAIDAQLTVWYKKRKCIGGWSNRIFFFLLSQFVCNRPKKTHTNLHPIISSLILIFCTATNFWVFTRAGALISPLRNWCCHKKLLHSNIFCCIRTNTYSTRCYFRKNRIWTIAQQEVQKMFRFLFVRRN